MPINQNQIKGYANKNTTLTQDMEKIFNLLEELTNKFGSLDISTGTTTSPGSGITNGLKQLCKLGVIGSPETPRIVNIPIDTVDFRVPKVNVLKYTKGEQDIIKIKNDFTNGESNDFVKDPLIIFDGTAHLKTQYDLDYKLNKNEPKFTESYTTINLKDYKAIASFTEKSRKLIVNAIPEDRILTPKSDMDLNNIEHIDFFKIKALGKNIKIVSSNDSGKTWYTYISGEWRKIDLKINEIKEYGMSIDTFNNVNNVKWNEFNKNKKIRFAYLFSMDNIDDKEIIDQLSIQQDGQGRLMQAKDTEYDVIYVNNELLQVHIKFSGDIKINY